MMDRFNNYMRTVTYAIFSRFDDFFVQSPGIPCISSRIRHVDDLYLHSPDDPHDKYSYPLLEYMIGRQELLSLLLNGNQLELHFIEIFKDKNEVSDLSFSLFGHKRKDLTKSLARFLIAHKKFDNPAGNLRSPLITLNFLWAATPYVPIDWVVQCLKEMEGLKEWSDPKNTIFLDEYQVLYGKNHREALSAFNKKTLKKLIKEYPSGSSEHIALTRNNLAFKDTIREYDQNVKLSSWADLYDALYGDGPKSRYRKRQEEKRWEKNDLDENQMKQIQPIPPQFEHLDGKVIDGDKVIVVAKTAAQVESWGHTMKHCFRNSIQYAEIVHGSAVFLAIFDKEKMIANVKIRHVPDNDMWVLDDIRGFRNSEADRGLWEKFQNILKTSCNHVINKERYE